MQYASTELAILFIQYFPFHSVQHHTTPYGVVVCMYEMQNGKLAYSLFNTVVEKNNKILNWIL